MVLLPVAALVGFLAATVTAVDITVQASGGNKTSRIPYGLMHEVRLAILSSYFPIHLLTKP